MAPGTAAPGSRQPAPEALQEGDLGGEGEEARHPIIARLPDHYAHSIGCALRQHLRNGTRVGIKSIDV